MVRDGAPDDAAGSDIKASVARAPLTCAAAGWPVFPTRPDVYPCPYPPGKCECKAPLTRNGFKDATIDPGQIRAWWRRWPDANVAIATGAPGPDVLDVDDRPEGSGWAAFNRLKRAGLLTGAAVLVRTPSGGLHAYFAGTSQGCGKLPRHWLDFKSAGGYVLTPPSRVHGKPYELLDARAGHAALDWQAVRRLLDPPPQPRPRRQPNGKASGRNLAGIVRYLSGLHDGEQRWKQLYWGACRAAELIAAGKISESEARDALLEAGRANGYIADHSEREALRKIARGLADGAP
jgi:Bifunctional DNA primase/polymerase, N-terminal